VSIEAFSRIISREVRCNRIGTIYPLLRLEAVRLGAAAKAAIIPGIDAVIAQAIVAVLADKLSPEPILVAIVCWGSRWSAAPASTAISVASAQASTGVRRRPRLPLH